MANPELNLSVTADISALTAAMQTAQASVSASAEKMQRSLENLGKIDLAAQADDLRMQLAILQEMDPILRAQLEARAAFVKLDREARQLAESGGSAGEREIVRLKQAIAGEQARQNVAKARQNLIAEIDAKESASEAKRQSAINRLIQSNQQLAAAVGRTADSMSQRFDQAYSNINRGFGRVGRGAQTGLAVAAAAAGDLDGTLMALPGSMGLVAMAGKSLYDTLHESFTGAKAAAEELDKQLAIGAKTVGFRKETEDLEKQMAILKERDPFEKRRLETQRQIAAERARFMELDTEGATPEAIKASKAREALILEQEQIDLIKIRAQVEQEGIARNQKQASIEEQSERAMAQHAKERTQRERALSDLRTKLAMVEQPENRRRLELEQDLLEIQRRREDSVDGVSAHLADQIALAERNLVIAESTVEMEEELGQKRLELLAEEQQARERMQGVATVESSFGGALRVANEAAQRGQTVMSEKQVELQQEIRNLVRDIAATQRLGGIQ